MRDSQTDSQPQFEAWQAYYREMSQEGMAFFQKGMEMAQEMTPFYPGSELFTLWSKSYQDFITRLDGQSPPTFGDPMAYRKLYETWVETWTASLEDYMRSAAFASKSGKDLERFAEFKKKTGELLETYWATLHLPSSADMREIYHKLYLIDRKLDELDERFWILEEAIQQAKTPKKPGTQRDKTGHPG